MLRDITLGQYYQTDSVIHKLDPRVKLVATIVFIISLFLIDNFIGYIIAAAFLASIVKLSKVPFRYMITVNFCLEAYGYERGSEICGDDGGKACILDYRFLAYDADNNTE